MSEFEWMYHRNGCNTCARAQDFLSKHKIKAKTTLDARKNRMGPKEALELASKVDQIFATKGTKVVHLDLKNDKPDAQTITSIIIGPSGNLRAPTLKDGKILLVGFDEATYKKILK